MAYAVFSDIGFSKLDVGPTLYAKRSLLQKQIKVKTYTRGNFRNNLPMTTQRGLGGYGMQLKKGFAEKKMREMNTFVRRKLYALLTMLLSS